MPRPRLPDELAARFEFIRLAGKGSVGHVLEVRERESGETYALKIAHHAAVDPEELIEIFRQEYAHLSLVHHPGIVAAHEFGVCDGLPFLRMVRRWRVPSRTAEARAPR